jgi:hypothetical protein
MLLAIAAATYVAGNLASRDLVSREPRRLLVLFAAAATSLRASTMQFGYFIGSSTGGAALAVGGFRALGAVMASLFLAAAAALLPMQRRVAARRVESTAGA